VGTYYIGIVIDSQEQVPEADESNNTALDTALATTLQVEQDEDLVLDSAVHRRDWSGWARAGRPRLS